MDTWGLDERRQRVKYTIAVVLIIVAVTIACAPPAEERWGEGLVIASGRWGIAGRIEDEEAGVVCYVYNNAGIDCLPIGCTLLWEGDDGREE